MIAHDFSFYIIITIPFKTSFPYCRQRCYRAYLDDLEELHWFDGDVILHDTVDHSARTELFAVNALSRVDHSTAFVDREVVAVEDGRRRQETETQTIDDRRIVATVEAQLGDEVADETVRRKFFDDQEFACI